MKETKPINIRFMKIKITIILLITMLTAWISLPAQTWGDYTFYSPKTNNKAYLVDMSGNTYHTWTFASNAQTGYSSYLLPGGTVLRSVAKQGNYFTGGPICGEVQKVDWNGNVIWDYVYSTTAYCSHHDIHPMPNGNVLLIAYETKTPAEVTQAGCSQSITMWPDKIVEIQPVGATGGNVVWEWKVWDHLCQNYNSGKSNYVTSIVQHPELLNINYNTQKDWMHVNGVDYNEALDQIVFSSHNMNEFYVIDHSTTTAEAAGHIGGNSGKGGDFLYRWGNPSAYQAAGTTNFNVVHNAHWVPADCPHANYLVGFNNKGGTGNKSCIDLINPPYNGYNYNITPGSAFTPATYSWRHTYSGTPTQNEGHSQQLPNGNMLITISLNGYMYEIDSNQNVVWSKTISGQVTNARRYSACYVSGPLTVSTVASPGQCCAGTSVQLTTTVSGGSGYNYSWTSIPAGFTSTLQNPVVTPTVTTSYIVNVTSGSCSGGDTVTVTVVPSPTVVATATPQEICRNSSTQLNAYPSGTASYSYSWSSDPAGFTSFLQNPVATPTVNTKYFVNIAADGCQASGDVQVTVNELPSTPVISYAGDSLVSSASTGNQWYKDSQLLQGETGQYLALTGPGTYQVQVTSGSGCMSAMSAPIVYVGVDENLKNSSLKIYPNPTSGMIYLAGSGVDSRTFSFKVFNSVGKMVVTGKNLTSIDLSGLGEGFYYLILLTDRSETFSKKIILTR